MLSHLPGLIEQNIVSNLKTFEVWKDINITTLWASCVVCPWNLLKKQSNRTVERLLKGFSLLPWSITLFTYWTMYNEFFEIVHVLDVLCCEKQKLPLIILPQKIFTYKHSVPSGSKANTRDYTEWVELFLHIQMQDFLCDCVPRTEINSETQCRSMSFLRYRCRLQSVDLEFSFLMITGVKPF